MANQNLDLALRVRADLNNAIRQLDKMERELDGTDRSARKASTGIQKMERSTQGLSNQIKGLVTVAAAGLAIRGIVQAADEYTNLESQLRLVTDSQEELNGVFADTQQLAQDTRQDLSATVELYARLSRSTEELGLEHQDLLSITRAINQSYIVSGASAQEAAASTLQLSQGLASGTLRGEELNSVLENSPRLARAIADGLGVTIGELRELGAQGELTGEAVTRALLKTADDINTEFQQMPRTVGQALQQLRNDFLVTFGQTDTSGFVDAIDDLREIVTDPEFQKNMVTLGSAIANVTAAMAGAVSETVSFTEWLGEELAASIGGIADDDIVRLEQRLFLLKDQINRDFLDQSVELTFRTQDSIDEEIAELESKIAAFYQRQDEQARNRPAVTPGTTDAKGTDSAGSTGGSDSDTELTAIQKRIKALEEEAAVYGKSRREAELYKLETEGATPAELAAAAAALDHVAALEQAQEAMKQAADDTKALAEIENQLLSLQGNGAQARSNELEAQYGDLIARLEARSDEAGIELVKRLINVEQAQAQLDELQQAVNTTLADQSRQEQSIRAQQEAGVISEVTAREQLLELHRATAQEIEALIPKMEALAEATGNPEAIERVKQLKAEIEQLNLTTDQYATTARDAFESSVTDGLLALAEGASNLEDVIKGVVRSIAQAIAQLAAQKAAAQAADAAGGVINAALSAYGGGYADGGYTGPGGKYQVAGVVHAGEYVQPAHIMREPGAIEFMESFRREGMRALNRFNGYAEGGLVSPSSITVESPAATIGANIPAPQFNARMFGILDKDLMSEALMGPDGEEVLEFHFSRNPGKFRSALGVG